MKRDILLNPDFLLQNRYKIVSLLGKGGMGEVYLAEDLKHSSKVAVKKILYSHDEILYKAAEKEAGVLKRLQHRNLPRVWDYFDEEQIQYIVMEYVPGFNLAEMLQSKGSAFSPEVVLRWADDLLDAIIYLHSHTPPVVHRDIKPQNLKITDKGEIYLLDFGLVKDTPTRLKSDSLPQTVAGFSESYSPLEQINGDPTSVQTDIYGLCATLYNLLTNFKPANALDRATQIIKNKPDSLIPVNEIAPDVTRELSDIITRGLELNIDERIASATILRRLLAEQTEPHVNASVPGDGNRITVDIPADEAARDPRLDAPIPHSPRSRGSYRRYLAIAASVIIAGLACWGGYIWLYADEVKAAKLLEEAEKIERTEGPLNQIACSKYQELQKLYNATDVAKGAIGKSNSCTNVQSLFDQAKAKEKEKGLMHETIEFYKKVADGYPDSSYGKQADGKVAEFEKIKQATLKAWNEVQEIKNLETSARSVQAAADLMIRFQKIDVSKVDPLLITQINSYRDILNELKGVSQESEAEAQRLTELKKEEVRKYCEASLENTQGCINNWWTTNKEGQEQGAWKAATDKFKDRTDKIMARLRSFVENEQSISSTLNGTYNVTFTVL